MRIMKFTIISLITFFCLIIYISGGAETPIGVIGYTSLIASVSILLHSFANNFAGNETGNRDGGKDIKSKMLWYSALLATGLIVIVGVLSNVLKDPVSSHLATSLIGVVWGIKILSIRR